LAQSLSGSFFQQNTYGEQCSLIKTLEVRFAAIRRGIRIKVASISVNSLQQIRVWQPLVRFQVTVRTVNVVFLISNWSSSTAEEHFFRWHSNVRAAHCVAVFGWWIFA
jgi:hypothetical protein